MQRVVEVNLTIQFDVEWLNGESEHDFERIMKVLDSINEELSIHSSDARLFTEGLKYSDFKLIKEEE